MKKLFVGVLLAAVSCVAAAADDQAVVARYNKSCMVCHASGVANAPKTGSEADWKPLVASVKTGMNAMPPRGMCNDCTDADYKALINYMATPKK
jgi:cytochrome c5